jgi:hypothetical protein
LNEIVIHANVKFDKECLYCKSPFDYHEEEEYDYEGDPMNNSKGHYKCGTTLESLVQDSDWNSVDPVTGLRPHYGPPRTFEERLIERSWACEQLAARN